MATKPKSKENAKPAKNKKKSAKSGAMSGRLLLVLVVIGAIVFLPTTILIMVGMLPSVVAILFSIRGSVARGYSVAATNFVGCFVFLLELWSTGNTFERSVDILLDPLTIVLMYGAAGFGYVLDWALSGLVANLVQQRGKTRLVNIRQRQQDLIEQWGRKVTGDIPLDEDGFPVPKI
jgi:hypothetical protein